jgi:trypsin-like peptidase
VLVIGNPEGFQGTVSDGIIAAFREGRSYIQITAPISPGSSGSPVLDESGQVIGLARLVYMEGQNLNFAISSETISNFLTRALSQQSSPTSPASSNNGPGPTYPAPPSRPSSVARDLLNRTSIKDFVQNHLQSVENRQLDAYMSGYDDYVVWYGEGRVPANKIRQEMRSYLNSWDSITYKVVGPIRIYPIPDSRRFRVSYSFALDATSQQPPKHRSRAGTETVEIEIVNERLEIISENQQLQ